MKKIIIPMLALAAGISFTSCEDQLDIPQKGIAPIESFYKTDADAEQALAAAYNSFMQNVCGRLEDGGPGIYTPRMLMHNNCGDDMVGAGEFFGDNDFSPALDEFRYDPQNTVIREHYTGLYLSIYKCNLVLDNFKNPSTAFQKQVVAEARVLRAYDFFVLATLWGNPPFVDHVLSGSALPYNCDLDPEKPMSHEELINWVATECESAVADLTKRNGTADKDGSVRVTKGFALALAGKAHLFNKNWEKAEADLLQVIQSNDYSLVPGERYMDNFHIEGDCNEEKVFEVNFEYNPGISDWGGAIQHSSWMEANIWNWRSDHFVAKPNEVYTGGVDGWGGLGVPQWFGDEFFANDGHSYRFDATLKHIDDVVYNMPYVDKALNAMSVDEKKASTKVGIGAKGLYGQSFWLPFKQIIRKGDSDKPEGGNAHGNNNRLNNYRIMRYAEVLLNYAEAAIMNNHADKAFPYIKQIQERAGSKTVVKSASEVNMEVLKREKSYELWLEGCRWFDILRWEDAAAIERLKNAAQDVPLLYDKLIRPVEASDKGVKWENGTEANSRFYTVSTHAAKDAGNVVGYKPEKHRYFPFPQDVINKNPNLQQHKAWLAD